MEHKNSPSTTTGIRPVIQNLIARGNVQLDEISGLNCSRLEATALIPVLTGVALAMRIERTLAHLISHGVIVTGSSLDALAPFLYEACRRLESEPAQASLTNAELAVTLQQRTTLAITAPADPTTANSWLDALYFLGMNAATRLQG